jgi:uncharacterized repeat protein (TIGR01451 family)
LVNAYEERSSGSRGSNLKFDQASVRPQGLRASIICWLAICWLGTVAASATGPNLLTNGDFSGGFSGWSTVAVSPGAASGYPRFVAVSISNCLTSQNGNPYVYMDVPDGASGYISQGVDLSGDAVLALRSWGELDAVTVSVTFVDGAGTEHLLDTFTPPLTISGYTLGPPLQFFCSGAASVTKSYPITGFGGQHIEVRFYASSIGSDGTIADFDDVSLTAAAPELAAGINVSPSDVAPGDDFDVTVTATNGGTTDLTAVQPTASMAVTTAGGAQVQLVSGPTPTQVPTLAAGGQASFVYHFHAVQPGTATFAVTFEATDAQNNQLTAQAVCQTGSGCSDTVTIGPPCKVTLSDVSPPIYVARLTGRILQDPSGGLPAVACGAGGMCHIHGPIGDSQAQEADSVPLTTEARQTTKNVGQEVKLQAAVTDLLAGLTLSALRWTVDGDTIEHYTDIAGYLAGKPEALDFTPSELHTDWTPETDPTQTGGDGVGFFWRDTGSFDVQVEAVAKDSAGNEHTCTVTTTFDVERNATDPDKQPEDFFTSCCSDQPERVTREHEAWHNQIDNLNPPAGDDWLNFHRTLVRDYAGWRDFFGYPALGTYDGSGPIPDSENGFTLADDTRLTNTPQCAPPGDPRNGTLPIGPNCPLPPWYTASGNGTPRPAESLDVFFTEPRNQPSGWQAQPHCYKAKDYNLDGCDPVGDNTERLDLGQTPNSDATVKVCAETAGIAGLSYNEPPRFEVGPTAIPRDPASVGQTKLGDFSDNVELGCLLTRTWHGLMHQLIGGAMTLSRTSPKDPVFYRIHQLLSGVTVPGQPTTLYDSWEGAASGSGGQSQTGQAQTIDTIPPQVDMRFPYPSYVIGRLTGVAVSFWENVTGVVASNMVVNGSPATQVTGSGKGPYLFTGFAEPTIDARSARVVKSIPAGSHDHHGMHGMHGGGADTSTISVQQATVNVIFSPGGVQDLSGNAFAGDGWTYTLETDTDGDGIPDSVDNCPTVYNPGQENSGLVTAHGGPTGHIVFFPGNGLGDACNPDSDGDGFPDAVEIACGSDPHSRASVPDPSCIPGDTDGDGVPNAVDGCYLDPNKTAPGVCGCGVPDVDSDHDGTPDCIDACPFDPGKTAPGECGCGFREQRVGGVVVSCVAAVAPAPAPDLTVQKSHLGTFQQGDSSRQYTIRVFNVGSGPSTGTVTATDSLPAGLTATAFGGPGWTACTTMPAVGPATLSCQRSDVLAGGSSYPPITVTVDVAAVSPFILLNTARVSGGGETATGSDPTAIGSAAPDLTVQMSHSGNFTQGDANRQYSIIVTNLGGAQTGGVVTVTVNLPAGLVATGLGGPGWTACTAPTVPGPDSLSCQRSDALPAGGSYPPLVLTVSVASDAPPLVSNFAQVLGGGEINSANDIAIDPTVIVSTAPVAEVPALSPHALALLALLLSTAALLVMRRIRSAG